MKKLLFILVAILAIAPVRSQITVPNGDFELLNDQGQVSNWGKILLLDVGIDSADTLTFDGMPYFPSSDAHTGVRALEMRNAYNFFRQKGYAGGAHTSSEEQYAGFETPVIVASHVTDFGFYYKYFPVNNDTAQASIEAYDSNGTQIGEAQILISGTASSYKFISAKIHFTEPGTVATVMIRFNTFYTAAYPSRQPGFGTRLLIDDITLTNTSGIDQRQTGSISIYPNPCREFFSVSSSTPIESVYAYDLTGREIKLDYTPHNDYIPTSSLSPGDYIIKIITATAVLTKKLVVD